MAKVCVRRLSDHYFVHAIREAIRKVSQQKQCPNEERIVRTVLQEFDWTKQQVSEQLHFAVEDGLISRVTTTSNHGKTKGIPQTAYRVYLKDSDENENEQVETKAKLRTHQTHDWYCWKCHGPGEVMLCDLCPKVFHKECSTSATVNDGQWKCPSCQPQEESVILANLRVEDLSKMLLFTLDRMKEKAKEFLKPFSVDNHWDYPEFVYKPMDLGILEALVTGQHFKTTKAFREETWWIVHNAIVYFGDDDELTDLAESIMEDCDGELEELERCPDCYMRSNTREKNWFTKPCKFPHELVWAKMSGEPPWPAKLLSWNEDRTKALVRFFGIAHQRAWVADRNIVPIHDKPDVKKRPQRWLQAQEEMRDYQRQLHLCKPGFVPEITSTKANAPRRNHSKPLAKEQHSEVDKLTLKIENLETELKACKAELDAERDQARQFLNSLQRKETERNQRVLRARSVVEQITENNVDGAPSEDQALLIKNLQDALERERQEKRDIAERITRDAQKNKEKECQQLVKRAVNKERLEREKIVQVEVRKAVERAKAESERTLQKALHCAGEDAEKAQRALKRKQWCANCGAEAFYPCCWNTSYCTLTCQKTHWCDHKYNCVRVPCNCTRDHSQR